MVKITQLVNERKQLIIIVDHMLDQEQRREKLGGKSLTVY